MLKRKVTEMKEFTKEMLDKLIKANEEVKATPYYYRYHMQCDAKTNGRWNYIGWYIPNKCGIIKIVKLTTYIVTEDSNGELLRYTVNLNVKELLGI